MYQKLVPGKALVDHIFFDQITQPERIDIYGLRSRKIKQKIVYIIGPSYMG